MRLVSPIGQRMLCSTDVVIRDVDASIQRRLDAQFYDAHSGSLVASATWKDSRLHAFHDFDDVVPKMMSDVVAKLK